MEFILSDSSNPNPDIHNLFVEFNQCFFDDKLAMVEVRWSKRMTLCAGVCVFQGKHGLCSIRLSEPLLKFRPKKDLVETLLHEMIHALLFVTHNNKDHDAHGPEFIKHMTRINKSTGLNISVNNFFTVYHNFHDEVDFYRTHIWRCNGPCQKRRPFFGFVKRSMNRAPSKNDRWWSEHQQTCGGTFHKISEPDKQRTSSKGGMAKTQTSNATKKVKSYNVVDIRSYIRSDDKESLSNPIFTDPESPHKNTPTMSMPLNGGNKLGNGVTSDTKPLSKLSDNPSTIQVREKRLKYLSSPGDDTGLSDDTGANNNAWPTNTLTESLLTQTLSHSQTNTFADQSHKAKPEHSQTTYKQNSENIGTVLCPVCGLSVVLTFINEHLDFCMAGGVSSSVLNSTVKSLKAGANRDFVDLSQSDSEPPPTSSSLANCPVCLVPISLSDMNSHLDDCAE